MTIDRTTLLFFDSSCLIAAAGSPTGGSSVLLSLCASNFLSGAVSQPVLLEARRNIQTKLGQEAQERFNSFLFAIPFIIAPIPDRLQLKYLDQLVNKKDLHVVGAALAIGASYLITLDKNLSIQVKRGNLRLQALTPGEFITTTLPTHIDYPRD